MPSQTPTVSTPNQPRLSPQQVQAANLLAAGQSPTQVAITLSLGRSTLYRWQQDPDFLAYFNELVRQRESEVTALASSLATESLRLIQTKLHSPETPIELQLRIAFRILSLYTRPGFLKHLSSLSDDPDVIAEAQACQAYKAMGNDPKELDGGDIELYGAMTHPKRLAEAQIFDAAYPHPETAATPSRDKMRQNGAPGARSAAPAPIPTATPINPACAAAVTSALTGLTQRIHQSAA